MAAPPKAEGSLQRKRTGRALQWVALGAGLASALTGCRSTGFGGFDREQAAAEARAAAIRPSAAAPVRGGPSGPGARHRVQPGDTVYSLARRYGSTPRLIQAANRLDAAYTITVGQTLRIPPVRGAASAPVYRAPPPPSAADPLPAPPPPAAALEGPNLGARQTSGPARPLARPVAGEIVTPFGSRLGAAANDGVDIAAAPGSAVVAADDGQVAFVSEKGGPVGAVMLVQHPGGLVTIYGRIANLAVRQGDRVARGQKLAEVADGAPGETARLHFELRRGSKPIDPTPYL